MKFIAKRSKKFQESQRVSQEFLSYAFNKVVAVSGAKCWHDVNHSKGGLQKPPHWPLTPTERNTFAGFAADLKDIRTTKKENFISFHFFSQA